MARRTRSGQLEMNFDGLADSVTNLVGALILLVVLMIGLTKDAVSQSTEAVPASDDIEGHGVPQKSVRPLNERIAQLKGRVNGVNRDVEGMKRNLESLRQETQELLEKVDGLQPPANDDAPEPVPEKPAKKLTYRPPLERIVVGGKSITFLVEGGCVSLLDYVALNARVKELIAGKQGVVPIDCEIPESDFRVHGEVKVTDGNISGAALEVVRLPGRTGESLSDIEKKSSRFRQTLAAIEDQESVTVQFDVCTDSFDAFRHFRQVAWDARLPVAWDPYLTGAPYRLGFGIRIDRPQ